MITRQQLLSSPEYWFEEAQNDLYRQVIEYMEQEGLTQTQLAGKLGVSKGYVSQILKGEFNYTLKKLIDISLAIGCVPKIEYKSLESVMEDDRRTEYLKTHYLTYEGAAKSTTIGSGERSGLISGLATEPFLAYGKQA